MDENSQTRLHIARHAGRLFLEHGVAGTSGDDIAEAVGISKRTVWRHFRTKESCVAPLFLKSSLHFASQLDAWPANRALEDHLRECFSFDDKDPVTLQDEILVARLVSILPREPDLHGIWLLCCHQGEVEIAKAIAARLRRAPDDFEVRLCAATVSAAVRMVDETVSVAAIEHGEQFTIADVVDRLAGAIRAASTLPFCDPITPNAFGSFTNPKGAAKAAPRT